MLYAYVHFDVDGVPVDAVDDDAFATALWRALPDAGVSGGGGHPLGLTLSQFALSDRDVIDTQAARVRRALAEVGWAAATVRVDAVERGSVRDDLDVVLARVRWRLGALLARRSR